MTLVDMRTGELTDISVGDVRASIAITTTHLEKAAEQIIWQVQHKVWTLLGHASWDDMREAEYGGAAVMVPRADRPELVAAMRAEGLSQQQIGDTLGVSDMTVGRDVQQMLNVSDLPTTRVDSLGREQPTRKPRQAPDEPKVPARRSALATQARSAGFDLQKAVERVQRIAADDRFTANRDAIAPHLCSHLHNTVDACQALLDQLNKG